MIHWRLTGCIGMINGKFTDVSNEAGISGNPLSFGLGIAVADFNNDGLAGYLCKQ